MEELSHGLQLDKGYKGQSSIEFSLAFIIALLFLVLTARVFVWFGGNLIRRQVAYENSRKEAGSTNPGQTDFYKSSKLDLFGKDISDFKDGEEEYPVAHHPPLNKRLAQGAE